MTPPPSRYLAALRDQTPAMLDLLERLVNIDSGSYHAPGVDAVGAVLAERLAALGFAIARQPIDGRGAQVTATRRLGGAGRLLILGHLDTVWPVGTVAGWRFAHDDARASGPGVGDMKGGLVLALFALELLLREGLDGLGSICFLLVPDEELGSVQSRAWIEGVAADTDWALVLEPARPGGGLVTARGAVGAVFLEAAGTSAHAAVNFAKGASAVRALARLVEPLEALSRPADGVTVNVGVFRGGAARQVVPHEATLHLDVRARAAADAERLLAEVRALVAEVADPRVTVTLRGGFTRPAFPRGAGTAALYARAAGLAGALGLPVFETASSGGSDGSFAAALGVPTLDGLGPICHDTCSRDETIEIASLAERGAVFAGLIASLANGSAAAPSS